MVLIENLLLALVAGVLGCVIAAWGTEALRAVPLPGGVPLKFRTGIDVAGYSFAFALAVGCGVLFGSVPALHLARIEPQGALRAGSRSAGRSRFRNMLMGGQVALAVLVLFVAALFLGSFRDSRTIDPGFRVEGVLLAAYDLTGLNLEEPVARGFARRLLDRLRVIPGVESAAIASSVPLDIHGLPSRPFTLEGRAQPAPAPDEALTNVVTPGYFDLMGIPIRQGTDFSDLANGSAPPEAVVNEEFVRRYAGTAEPIGRHITSRGATFAIVGIVRNSLYESFGESPAPAIYFSYRDRATPLGQIHVRTLAGAEIAVASEVRRATADIAPSLPLYDVRTLAEHIDRNLVLRRIPARMFSVLGPVILLLAATGIYAVVAYTVAQRRIEISLRLAVGATEGRVVAQIVGESLQTITIGAVAGWLVTLLIVFDLVGASGPTVAALGVVPAVLLIVASAACWWPARRATLVDPMAALRNE